MYVFLTVSCIRKQLLALANKNHVRNIRNWHIFIYFTCVGFELNWKIGEAMLIYSHGKIRGKKQQLCVRDKFSLRNKSNNILPNPTPLKWELFFFS